MNARVAGSNSTGGDVGGRTASSRQANRFFPIQYPAANSGPAVHAPPSAGRAAIR
jgi:hypothetical protein